MGAGFTFDVMELAAVTARAPRMKSRQSETAATGLGVAELASHGDTAVSGNGYNEGSTVPDWPHRFAADAASSPNSCNYGVASTPALGFVNRDGD